MSKRITNGQRLDFIADHVDSIAVDVEAQTIGVCWANGGKQITTLSDEDQHPHTGLRQAIDRAIKQLNIKV